MGRKVVADVDIPFLKGVLEPYADVVYFKGGEITPQVVSDADALIIRTRTRCDEHLLKGSRVKFIATATIGTDHIDREYLKSQDIALASAPGCNAGGVMQYVFTTLFGLARDKGLSLFRKTLGVVGVGNTGGLVSQLGEHLGFNVLRNDPPKEALSSNKGFYCSIERLLAEADIISLHLPLDSTTRGMVGEDFFRDMKPGAIFINASRGEVVCDDALVKKRGELSGVILDVWNGEPTNISPKMVELADIATPHIAGYSYEGKVNGTAMAVQAVANFFGIDQLRHFTPETTPTPFMRFQRSDDTPLSQDEIAAELLELFPVYKLDKLLREDITNFEKIRSEYIYRREFRWK